MLTGARQARRIKENYLKAGTILLLHQLKFEGKMGFYVAAR